MTIKLTHLPTSNAVSMLSWIVISAFCHSEIYWDSLEILRFFLIDFVEIDMLQYTYWVWVRGVYLSSEEVSIDIGFIEFSQVRGVYSVFYDLSNEVLQIRQWNERLIQKSLLHKAKVLGYLLVRHVWSTIKWLRIIKN